MNFTRITKSIITTSFLLSATTGLVLASPHRSYKDHGFFKDKPVMTCPTIPVLNDGFYIGATAGYGNTRNQQMVSAYNTVTHVTNILSDSKLGANGWLGGLYLGDGRYFKNVYYLGAEVFGNLSTNYNTRSTDSPKNFDSGISSVYSKFTTGNSYGISVLPGIKVNDGSLVYVRLGYKWTNFKYSSTVTATDKVSSSEGSSKLEGGFNAGVGIETLLYGNWSLRGEYTYTNYDSFNVGIANKDITTVPYNANFSPTDNQFNLGLTYHIA